MTTIQKSLPNQPTKLSTLGDHEFRPICTWDAALRCKLDETCIAELRPEVLNKLYAPADMRLICLLRKLHDRPLEGWLASYSCWSS